MGDLVGKSLALICEAAGEVVHVCVPMGRQRYPQCQTLAHACGIFLADKYAPNQTQAYPRLRWQSRRSIVLILAALPNYPRLPCEAPHPQLAQVSSHI